MALSGYVYVWTAESSLSFEGDSETPASGPISVSSGLSCKIVAVYLTFVQFILLLKLYLYTIVHLLCLSAQSLCRTVSPRVGVGVPQKGLRSPYPA